MQVKHSHPIRRAYLMGHGKRPRPERLGSKLRHIREQLMGGMTQAAMAKELIRHGADSTLHSGYIADYENNKAREPSLLTLLAYSKASGVSVNLLIDDELDLPKDNKSTRKRVTH
jgi:transcriptional regulator with XRE-family HTH domain